MSHTRNTQRTTPRTRVAVVTLAAVCIILTVTPGTVLTITAGDAPYEMLSRSSPGLLVGTLTALAHSIADTAAMFTLGSLAVLLFFRSTIRKDAAQLGHRFEQRVLHIAAAVWATASGAMVLLTLLDNNGQPFTALQTPGALAFLYQASAFPKAWTYSFVAALIIYFTAMFASRWTGLLIPLWAGIIGVIAPVVVGQVLVGPNHDYGLDSGVHQTLLTCVAFGTLLTLAARALSGFRVPQTIIPRFLLVFGVSLAIIIFTDLVLAWFKLAGTGLTASHTGVLILTRWVCLAGLTVLFVTFVHCWRADTLTPGLLRRLLISGAIIVSAWLGLTTAMTRIPPPQYFVPTSIAQVFMGYEVNTPPTFNVLLTHWRPNILFLVFACGALTVYSLAVYTLRRRGDTWPVGRTIAWSCGWLVVIVVTSSGLGKYSAPDFGIHMIVHMSLNMLAPVLLTMGGIVTLLLRAAPARRSTLPGPHQWLNWGLNWPVLRYLYNPLFVFILFISSYYGLYFTGIFDTYMRFHWAHQLMNVHFVIAGYLFYGLVIGVDRPPRPLPHIGKFGFALAAMPFHAFFGVILMSGKSIIAENFYRSLDTPWADLQTSQNLGGGVAWAGGEIPLLLVIIALGVQWSRQDSREAKRKDRHIDAGLDDEFDDYNRMLATLTARQTGLRHGSPSAPSTTPSRIHEHPTEHR